MSPGDKRKYEAIYAAHKSPHGSLTFKSLETLYDDLDVPDTDVRSAWNLVNPASEPAVGKAAALAFLHLLNMRHEGYRIPRTVPASLRATFEQGQIDYNVENARGVKSKAGSFAHEEDARSARKTKFGDAYLTRLGLDGSVRNPEAPTNRGTDFSTVKTSDDWEETRLKRQLQDLEAKMTKMESLSKNGRRREDSSRAALIRRELEQLLEYKRRDLRELEQGEGKVKTGQALKGLEEEIGSVKEMVEGLERHLAERTNVLQTLRAEVVDAKR